MIKPDKVLHLLAGATIAGLTYAATLNPIFALAFAVAAGIAKEGYDSLHPTIHTVDVWDAIATAAGAVPLVAVVYLRSVLI